MNDVRSDIGRVYRASGNGSGGILELETSITRGQCAGNMAITRIRLREGQYEFARARQLEDGIEIDIVGEFEAHEIAEFIKGALDRESGTAGWVEFEQHKLTEDELSTEFP